MQVTQLGGIKSWSSSGKGNVNNSKEVKVI